MILIGTVNLMSSIKMLKDSALRCQNILAIGTLQVITQHPAAMQLSTVPF
jgi:hypothetical protein